MTIAIMKRHNVLQAIVTKYLGPTNHRCTRIKAVCAARTIIIDYSHELSIENNHRAAALRMMILMGWTGDVYTGQAADGRFVHVQVSQRDVYARQVGLTPAELVESFVLIIRATSMRGPDQDDALAEMKKRGLWLSADQRKQAGLA